MKADCPDFNQLLAEYVTLSLAHGSAQTRCSALISDLRQKIDTQQKQIFQLRAAVIVRESALDFLRRDNTRVAVSSPGTQTSALETSLQAADLVICQTGCLSHGEYWRVQDHCKRLGKTCVLVEQPEAVRIVRIHKAEPTAAP